MFCGPEVLLQPELLVIVESKNCILNIISRPLDAVSASDKKETCKFPLVKNNFIPVKKRTTKNKIKIKEILEGLHIKIHTVVTPI